jgi:hypothetical protein
MVNLSLFSLKSQVLSLIPLLYQIVARRYMHEIIYYNRFVKTLFISSIKKIWGDHKDMMQGFRIHQDPVDYQLFRLEGTWLGSWLGKVKLGMVSSITSTLRG